MKSFIAALRSLVLPYGATSGNRIVLDGVNGKIQVYDNTNTLIAEISPSAGIEVLGTAAQTNYIALKADSIGQATLFIKPRDLADLGHVVGPAYLQATTTNLGGASFVELSIVGPSIDAGSTPRIDFISRSEDGSAAEIAVLHSNKFTIDSVTVVDNNNNTFYRGYNNTELISFVGVTSGTKVVNFPNPMAAIPKVFTNIDSGVGAAAQWHSRAINITANGFTLLVFASAAGTWTNIPVSWSAQLPS